MRTGLVPACPSGEKTENERYGEAECEGEDHSLKAGAQIKRM
jgi:hypothetical protein